MTTLEEITRIQAPAERCFDLARSVEVHLAGNVVDFGMVGQAFSPAALPRAGENACPTYVTTGLVRLSQRVTSRAKQFAISHTLTTSAAPRRILGRLALLRERNGAIRTIAESADRRKYLCGL